VSVGYTRVSTETQLDGYGLDIQQTAIENLAELEAQPLTATFTDGGISGAKDTDERPGLDALVQWCTEHPGEVVLLPKLDRLARSLAIQEHVLAVLWATSATVLSCDAGENHYLRTGDDPDDPTRTLIRQVLGAVAQFERGQISLRLRNGRRRKIADHGWAGGVEPYGWSDPDEQRVIADTIAMRAQRIPWRQVCATLTNRGDMKRNGKAWNETELCRVVRRARTRPSPLSFNPTQLVT
jgi:DNA invertase Pin-like site-specific DNA recombinase